MESICLNTTNDDQYLRKWGQADIFTSRLFSVLQYFLLIFYSICTLMFWHTMNLLYLVEFETRVFSQICFKLSNMWWKSQELAVLLKKKKKTNHHVVQLQKCQTQISTQRNNQVKFHINTFCSQHWARSQRLIYAE